MIRFITARQSPLGKKREKLMINFIQKNKQQVFAVILLLAAYFPILIWLWDRWFARDSYYSHGILIPFVTGYLIWQKKDILKKITPTQSSLGIPLIIFGLLIYLLSAPLRIYFTSGFSMLIIIYGLALHFYGWPIVRHIAFPLFFLFFMMPLPSQAIINISFRMKMFAAEIATSVLNGMGFQAARDGSIITMRHTQVIVDDVCSGLRSLISLTALGSIFAYWLNAPMYKKIILFLTTIPIAIIANVCRVVILSSISEIWGAEYATGFTHDATGYMVFIVAFILLYAASKLLE